MSMQISIGDDRDDRGDIDDDVDVEDLDERDDDVDDRARSKRRVSTREDDDEGDSDEDDDRSPDELKAEIRRLQASLKKSNATGLRRRNQLKELKAARDRLAGTEPDDEDDEQDDEDAPSSKRKPADGLDARAIQKRIDRARKEERRKADEQHTRDLIDLRAESAFARAGVSERNIRLLKREIDYEELEFDPKSRSVDGLEEEMDRLKSEFPDLFRGGKTAKRRINGGDDREGSRQARPMSASQRQAAALRGRS